MTIRKPISLLLLSWITASGIFFGGIGWGLDGCHVPLEMQTAPGIGIDLTMAYGAAAITFHNGTTHSLIQIHGSQEYRSAMKTLSEDAQNVRNGKNSTMKRIVLPLPNKVLIDWWSPYIWYRFLSDKLQPILNGRVALPEEEQPDDWVYTIAYMLSEIKSAAIDPMEPPLKFNYVLLSWPDFEFDTGHLYRGRIQLACRLAGLELMPRSNVVSFPALASECNDEWENQAETAMLVISYNAASFGITWNYKPPYSIPIPERLLESPHHGAEAILRVINPAQYWTEIQDLLETVIGIGPVDCFRLLGTNAGDPGLLQAIQDVIQRREGGDSSISLCGMSSISRGERGEDEDDPVFLAARIVSETAKVGMETRIFECSGIDDGDPIIIPMAQDEKHSEL